jgi:hypothetical protein
MIKGSTGDRPHLIPAAADDPGCCITSEVVTDWPCTWSLFGLYLGFIGSTAEGIQEPPEHNV